MNRIHNLLCRSAWWERTARERLVPWVLRGTDLGDRVLEIGPGFGATTRVLAGGDHRLTAVEIDGALAGRLRRGGVSVVRGDGTRLPFPDATFSGAVCFTMLHHVPSPQAQDRLFAEVRRVLRPGGVFAGSDSLVSTTFRLLHLADTMVTVDPGTLPERLRAAGFSQVKTSVAGRSVRFRAFL
ncbi:methyltransferase domain-containing protein [Actinoplanes sp. NPDC051861]|uniref:class I SAM-dependent methyltransferase n=1 Tax=Actinoplanes sp. NPDC051861 TaxID=3155170 RepID=UPI0034282071